MVMACTIWQGTSNSGAGIGIAVHITLLDKQTRTGRSQAVRMWREAGWPGTTVVTRRLLEWWFERDEERRAVGKRFFFCQQEAVETVIYLYEVQRRRKMPETGDLLRYAVKLDRLFLLPTYRQMQSAIITPAIDKVLTGAAGVSATLREIKGPLQALVPKDLP